MILNGTKTNPSPRFFNAISREFYVNPAWLRDGSGEIFSVPSLDLSPSDAALLAKYRLLPAEEQSIINEVVNAFLVKSMTKEEKALHGN